MEAETDRIREAEEVARRAVVLYGVVAGTCGAEREEILDWFEAEDLEGDLSADERAFMAAPEPSERTSINLSWHSERLIVLLWALGLAYMPPPDEKCEASAAERSLPPDADIDVAAFLASARLRPEPDLREMAETIYHLHAEARNARLQGREPRRAVDLEIIQERHHAINWVTGYEGLGWDEVTTDM